MSSEDDLTRDMIRSAEEAKRELRDDPAQRLRMGKEFGATGAAKQLRRGLVNEAAIRPRTVNVHPRHPARVESGVPA